MNNVIYKYKFDVEDDIKLESYKNARLLKIGIQNNKICFWMLVNPKEERYTYEFKVFGTGGEFDYNVSNITYIDTVFSDYFVWHIFEKCINCIEYNLVDEKFRGDKNE